MNVLLLTLNQTAMMFGLIVVGIILRKKGILPIDAGTVMARLETYVFVPALSLYTQMTNCTAQTLRSNLPLVLFGFCIVMICIFAAYPMSRLFVKKADTPEKAYRKDVIKYALVFGNYGFLGNYLILGVWGEEMFFKYSLFGLLITVMCYSWGLYMLVPKDYGASVWVSIRKNLLIPPMISIFLGIFIGVCGLTKYVPDFVVNALDGAGKCQGPVAMLLTGFVIGCYDIPKMLNKVRVYVLSFLRLIAIPAVILGGLLLFGASEEMIIFAMVTFATPVGLNVIVYPAAYAMDAEEGASMVVVSHSLAVLTIPLMYLIFVVLL